MVNLNLVHDMLKVGGGRPGPTAPAPARPVSGPSSLPEVQEIRSEEVIKKVVDASSKRPTKETSGQRKKAKVTGRHKSHREGEGSKSRATKSKGPASPVDEVSIPRTRPKSVRELCSAKPEVDGKNYHIIWMSNLPE
ncbi:hypothetical protein B296_00049876 [Ensete ventricosum]|uniref:Uncharacterized protein n=1 Tax=Ensete ventricosum TaxID=4639 RepID=A0A426YNV0_ENSVE|nr:hypothetical protein B296_00049876 [Ensete ventricosum]